VAELPILALTQEVEFLAEEYLHKLGLPRGAQLDVVHLACAVFYKMDYLLTWNCTHLANGLVIKRLQRANAALGRPTPIIATPEELLTSPGEVKMWKDPLVEEIHLVREKIAKECNYDLKQIMNRMRKKEKEHRGRVVSKKLRTKYKKALG
jgi:hypothetical protein